VFGIEGVTWWNHHIAPSLVRTTQRPERPRRLRWSSIRPLDLPLQDHPIAPVSLASNPILRLAIDYREQPHDDQRPARYVLVRAAGMGYHPLPHLEAMVRHAANLA
jgi:hypothetical protein